MQAFFLLGAMPPPHFHKSAIRHKFISTYFSRYTSLAPHPHPQPDVWYLKYSSQLASSTPSWLFTFTLPKFSHLAFPIRRATRPYHPTPSHSTHSPPVNFELEDGSFDLCSPATGTRPAIRPIFLMNPSAPNSNDRPSDAMGMGVVREGARVKLPRPKETRKKRRGSVFYIVA